MVKVVNVACGTDDGINFTNEHFGSAKFYLIYSLNLETGQSKYIRKIENTSVQEKIHGDPEKAMSISELLKDVQILMSFVMGPNIVRMRKVFIPVISRKKNINDALKKLTEKIDIIIKDLKIPSGENKEVIYFH